MRIELTAAQQSSASASLTLADLTPRQRQVAELIATGLRRREIAAQLSEGCRNTLSIRTVDVHLQAIAARLPKDELPASRRVRVWVRAQAVHPQREQVPAYAGSNTARTNVR